MLDSSASLRVLRGSTSFDADDEASQVAT